MWAGRAREHLFLLHENDRRELPSSWKMGSLLRRSGGCGGEVGTAITARKPRLGWGNGVEGPWQAASPPLAHPLDYKETERARRTMVDEPGSLRLPTNSQDILMTSTIRLTS